VKEAWALCRVPRERICRLRYTLEAYEGLCLSTTLPGRGGLVLVRTSPGLKEELRQTLAGLAEELPFEILRWGEGDAPDEAAALTG
jgi:hypothetical protein